jgi:hypothetical protein
MSAATPDREALAKALHGCTEDLNPDRCEECRRCINEADALIASGAVVPLDTLADNEALVERRIALAVAREHHRMVRHYEQGHECLTAPLCSGWPYSADDAYRTIAAVSNPGEREENRDGWAVTMRHRPDLFEKEAMRARERLNAAIAHGRAALVLAYEGGTP